EAGPYDSDAHPDCLLRWSVASRQARIRALAAKRPGFVRAVHDRDRTVSLRQKRGWTVLALTIALTGGAVAASLGKTFTLPDGIASVLSHAGLVSGTYPIRI